MQFPCSRARAKATLYSSDQSAFQVSMYTLNSTDNALILYINIGKGDWLLYQSTCLVCIWLSDLASGRSNSKSRKFPYEKGYRLLKTKTTVRFFFFCEVLALLDFFAAPRRICDFPYYLPRLLEPFTDFQTF